MSGFRVGDVVDITIKGAKVHDVCDLLGVVLPNGYEVLVDPTSDAVTVERVHPAEWPPQVADVWLDRNGNAWFCADTGHDGNTGLYFLSAAGDDKYIEVVAEQYGPLTLALRIGVDEATS